MTSCCVDKWTENALLTVLSKVCYRWSLCQEPCASKEVRKWEVLFSLLCTWNWFIEVVTKRNSPSPSQPVCHQWNLEMAFFSFSQRL